MAVFLFVFGALSSTWMSRIPVVKHDLGLSTQQLSVALVGSPAGLLVAMRLIPRLVAWRSSAFVATWSLSLGTVSLVLLALAWNLLSLALVLFIFGIALGAADVALNIQGVALERWHGRPVMSRLHAMWSVGILVGALAGSVTIGFGLRPSAYFVATGIALTILQLSHSRSLIGRAADANVEPSLGRGPELRTRRLLGQPRLLAVGVIAFSGLFAEGAVNDWAGVFLHQVRHASYSFSALAAAACGAGMVVGRLGGDMVIERNGRRSTLLQASLGGAIALTLAVLVPAREASIVAFAFLGVALATIVPSAFSMAGNVAGTSPAWAISRITTIGYIGNLSSPVIVGFAAHAAGLTLALMIPAILLLLVWPAIFVMEGRKTEGDLLRPSSRT